MGRRGSVGISYLDMNRRSHTRKRCKWKQAHRKQYCKLLVGKRPVDVKVTILGVQQRTIRETLMLGSRSIGGLFHYKISTFKEEINEVRSKSDDKCALSVIPKCHQIALAWNG